MRGIYRFHWDCGRMGELEGVFLSTREDVKEIVGKKVYFGEVLGKHSEVCGSIDEGEITLLTEDQDFIDKAIEYGLTHSGFNPFDYLQ